MPVEKNARWSSRSNEHGEFHYLNEHEGPWTRTLAKVYSFHGEPFRISVKDDHRRDELQQMCELYLAGLVIARMNHAS